MFTLRYFGERKECQLELNNAWEQVQYQNSMMTWYLITEKYTTSPWIASSMPSKIDSIRNISKHFENIKKISF